jgi:hypothetical protein
MEEMAVGNGWYRNMTPVFIHLCNKNYNKNISHNALYFCRKLKFKKFHSQM